MAFSHGAIVRSMRLATSDSNFDLVSCMFMCLGPLESIVRKGRLMSVYKEVRHGATEQDKSADYLHGTGELHLGLLSCFSHSL